MTVEEEQECPRCGSLLPDPEEGICRTCNYEYGRATLFMAAVPPPTHASLPGPETPPVARTPEEIEHLSEEVEHLTDPGLDLTKILIGLVVLVVLAFSALAIVWFWVLPAKEDVGELPAPVMEGSVEDSPSAP